VVEALLFNVVVPRVIEVVGLSVTLRPVTCTPEWLVTTPSKSTRISSTPLTGTTATEHSLVKSKGPGAGVQTFGSCVFGDTIHEALAGEIAVPPELVALTVAVFPSVLDADVVRKSPLYVLVAPGAKLPLEHSGG